MKWAQSPTWSTILIPISGLVTGAEQPSTPHCSLTPDLGLELIGPELSTNSIELRLRVKMRVWS